MAGKVKKYYAHLNISWDKPSNINTDSKQQRGKILTYFKKPMATSVNTGSRWTGGTGAGRGDGIMTVLSIEWMQMNLM